MHKEIIYISLNSTGVNSASRVFQFSAIWEKDGEIQDAFDSLINPKDAEVSDYVRDNYINLIDSYDAESSEIVSVNLKKWIGNVRDCLIIFYNRSFIEPMIKKTFPWLLKGNVTCDLKDVFIWKYMEEIKNVEDVSLLHVSNKFDIEIQNKFDSLEKAYILYEINKKLNE